MAARVCREALPSLADSSARLATAIQDSHSAHGGAPQACECGGCSLSSSARLHAAMSVCIPRCRQSHGSKE